MPERVLDKRELNRAVLARQLLLERTTLSIPRLLERICGIQNQYAPNAYIRLFASLEGFGRDDLTRALERRTVIQGTLMRETIHLVSRRDYAPFLVGTQRSLQEWWRRTNKQPDLDVRPLARRTRTFLRGSVRTRAELDALLSGEPAARGIGHWVPMVRVPPSGTWEHRRANRYSLAREWVGSLDVPERDAIEHLVRRYLAAFGPASRGDVSSFTGIPQTRLNPVLEALPLRRFADEHGRELLDVRGGLLPHPDTAAPPRFLSNVDSLVLVHVRRAGIVDEHYRKRLFTTKAPQGFPTFLVDGHVAGTWKYDGDRVVLDPFERISRPARRELDEEAERLRDFHR